MRNHRRSEKRTEAVERQEAHDKLTSAQKIAKLDTVLGKGRGAEKERAKLLKAVKAKPRTDDPETGLHAHPS